MNELPLLSPPEQTVAIVGVGLIGGSLAAALRERNAAKHVIGVGRDISRLNGARSAGLIDEASTDLTEVACRANLIVFCTPVQHVATGVRQVLSCGVTPESPEVTSPTLLMTDAGSVKGPICDSLQDVPNFIGAHPIAGSHRHGYEAADPNLFEGKVCVITPQSNASPDRVLRIERFWKSVGMNTVRMSPDAHDSALAMTSHLPHVVAASLASTLTPDNRQLTGTGFRDTTRVAAGDPDLWTGILLQNAAHVIDGLDAMQQQLEAFRIALKLRNADVLKNLLQVGMNNRESLDTQP